MSEATRRFIVNESKHSRDRRALAAEAVAFEADEADRAEMVAVASLMAAFRLPERSPGTAPAETPWS